MYVRPQVQVFQESAARPQALVPPLPAHLSGGHAKLIRYAEPDEKLEGALGQYNPNSEQNYSWPEKPVGAIVDTSYTKLFIDDALLRYWDSSDPDTGDTVLTVAGRSNHIAASTLAFRSNGSSYLHSASFLDRGVKQGDAVRLRATVDGDPYELCTSVLDFIAEEIASEIEDATAASTNAEASSATQEVNKMAGATNCITSAIDGSSTYDGLAAGHVEETYTIRVLQSSVDGDATTAVLRALSDSGTDDVLEFSPEAFGTPTEIGTRGVKVLFDTIDGSLSDCDEDADEEGVSADDFIAGQEWRVVASQSYTPPTADSNGTYTGDSDDTYIVEVTRGTTDDDPGQISVRTTRGLDLSGPTDIEDTSEYAIGTKGVTVDFTAVTLCKGDKWYIPVVAASEGAEKTLVLANSLPQAVIDNGSTSVTVELYIRKNIEVSANRTGFAPITNWSQSQTEFTVADGILAYDESWTDDGDPVALVVHTRCGYTKLYLEARYWLSTLANKLTRLDNTDDLDSLVSGAIHPDNPLKYAGLKALQNAGTSPVYLSAVCDPDDVDEWENMLASLKGRSGIYGLVPLTRLATVLSLFEAHVNDQSSPANGKWRTAWFNPAAPSEKVIIGPTTSEDGDVVMAVVEDDPDTSGTQYTIVRVPDGNANFVTNETRPGDIVRIEYQTDGFGGSTYTELIIDAVLNEDSLRVQSGTDVAITVAERIEVWRSLTTTEQAEELALTGGFSNKRIKYVWPDTIEADGYTVPGYFLCSALSALAGGVVPHQGLTNLEVAGFTSTPRTDDLFNQSHLDTMAEGGVWIVTQDPISGDIYTRHAITTGELEVIEEREEMVVRNFDSISYFLMSVLAPYIGVSNVVESATEMLRSELNAAIKVLTSSNYVPRLGSQLVSGKITELRQHALLKDRVVIAGDFEVPTPTNNIEMHQILVL